jgi:hypothetical protein
MSYDLTVFGELMLSRFEMIALVLEIPELHVEPVQGDQGLTVVKGKRASYCFTIDGPFRAELEDVPEEMVGSVLGVSAGYQVLIEGSADQSMPLAIRFAKKLAAAANGAVFDPQTDQVWAKAGQRVAARPERNERIDVIDIDWYFAGGTTNLAERYLAAARRHLPEALPRRFGEFEPLPFKLEESGDSGFVEAVDQSKSLLFWSAKFPALSGNVSVNSYRAGEWEPVPHISITVERSAFGDVRWRSALRSFFLEIGTGGGLYYAFAEVVRNLSWSGRTIWFDGEQENTDSLLRWQGGEWGWMGLNPYPVWWSLFGPVYVPLVAPHLVQDRGQKVGSDLFVEWSEAPLDRDALTAKLPRLGLLTRRRASWLPGELLAVQLPFDARSYPRPLGLAKVMPSELEAARRKR